MLPTPANRSTPATPARNRDASNRLPGEFHVMSGDFGVGEFVLGVLDGVPTFAARFHRQASAREFKPNLGRDQIVGGIGRPLLGFAQPFM